MTDSPDFHARDFDMHAHLYRRTRRLTGIASLLGLTFQTCSPGQVSPGLPTSARLRHDIGLPEIEDVPATPGIPHRRR
jgi:hypothetical protein